MIGSKVKSPINQERQIYEPSKEKEFYDSEAEKNRKSKMEDLKKKFDRVHLNSDQEEFFKNIKYNNIDSVKEQLQHDPSLINICDQVL